MMHNLDFSEFILNMNKLPLVGVSEGGVRGLTYVRMLFVSILKDKQVEYPSLKAQMKWPGI